MIAAILWALGLAAVILFVHGADPRH